jgi:hypothetical protein
MDGAVRQLPVAIRGAISHSCSGIVAARQCWILKCGVESPSPIFGEILSLPERGACNISLAAEAKLDFTE